ncbi:MAG: GTPase domain-containing protein [Trichodesmium sp. St15_bin1_1]|jgi:hypothetical protein|nr:GTPase domain-containing protein [Trichodesmium sp. MAG_R02]MDE5081055.1 GTPase domain-containing protein [Trichodesmium sp. St18_bin1]MDE5087931.1 GTPase domain-containing protein [Trichodesmium sp. St16_bin2-tuft]MDE5107060.1 GTPase domain-containing protein [Trichodesmium sp. St17_bin3_1_1]MDE5114019.1 GTPase domain-containing protein [Trichodesmium sp. St15_bin1_1]MDE5117185.1 GTPase domain-containing protein [Trichodesmium sp. St2_bin2_1]MDE5122594.1 GTPase domain-containing protein [
MRVVYIGDRAVGKTHLALELANPQGHYVRVSLVNQNYQSLQANLLNLDGTTKPTQTIERRSLNVEVSLPIGISKIPVDWIDSPGELFRRSWQSGNINEWEDFKEIVSKSEGIFLILPPYREILQPHIDLENYITQQQWCNRFNRWANFFIYDCPQARQIVICLNKADLVDCEIEQEISKLNYLPHGSSLNWLQRHNYVINSYFQPVKSELEQINKSRYGLSVRCFITSIYHRSLLELPWIYLANYLV